MARPCIAMIRAWIASAGGGIIAQGQSQRQRASNHVAAWGLSRGLAFLEAQLSSGSLTTARPARRPGRDAFTAPGSLPPPGSQRPSRLLRPSALPCQGVKDSERANPLHRAPNNTEAPAIEKVVAPLSPKRTARGGSARALSMPIKAAAVRLDVVFTGRTTPQSGRLATQ